MSRRFTCSLVLGMLLAAPSVRAEEESAIVRPSPTLADRFRGMRKDLFGADDEQQARPSAAQATQTRIPKGNAFGADRKIQPRRPSQTAANPRPAREASPQPTQERATAMNRFAEQRRTSVFGMPPTTPDEEEAGRVPTLARRSSLLGGMATMRRNEPAEEEGVGAGIADTPESGASIGATSKTATSKTPNSKTAMTAEQHLRNKLTAARQPTTFSRSQDSTAGGGTEGTSPATGGANAFSSRRWESSENAQEMVNPLVKSEKSEPPVDRAIGDPTSRKIAEATRTIRMDAHGANGSSRRGFGTDGPIARTASAAKLPEKTGAAPGGNGEVLIARAGPQIQVETTGPKTISVGKEATYTVHVANSGDVAAQDVTVSIQVPEWAEIVSSKGTVGTTESAASAIEPAANEAAGTAGGRPVQWHLPRIEPRGKEQLTLTIIPRQSRPFDLAVQWTVTPISSQARVEVQEPKLEVALSGPEEVLFGQTKIYKLTLSNPGTGDADNVIIQLSPLGDVAGPMTKHQMGSIAAGASKAVEIELTARQAGKVTIQTIATADGGLHCEAKEEVLVRRAELAVTASGAKTKYAGTVATYQVEVNNPGNAAAENVQVVATLPMGAKFVSATGGGQAATAGQTETSEGTKVAWTLPSLKAGGDARFEVKCVLSVPGANRLEVASTAAQELAASESVTTQVEALADLKLEVVDPKGPAAVGEEIAYEVRIRNRGSKAAEKVEVAGYFSEGIEPVAATGNANEITAGQVVFQPLLSIAPGGEATFKIKARADREGQHVFRAEVRCGSLGSKLVSEQTTLFYGDESKSGESKHVHGSPARDERSPSAKEVAATAEETSPSDATAEGTADGSTER